MITTIENREKLIQAIREQYVLNWQGIHGWAHWMSVLETGSCLPEKTMPTLV